MRSGTMRERLTWQQNNTTQDAHGDLIENWQNIANNATVWASVMTRASGERFLSGADQEMAEVTHTVRQRYRTDLTVQMRGVWRTNRYLYIENIVDPDGRKAEMVLMCREEQF